MSECPAERSTVSAITVARWRLAICVAVSVVCLQLLYWQWPRTVSWDVNWSIAAAQSGIESGRFLTISQTDFGSDLAEIKPRWLTGWPPAVMFLYAGLLQTGVSVGTATGAIAFIALLSGCVGWVMLFAAVSLPRRTLYAVAIAIPWTMFLASSFRSLYNDYVLMAMVPWALLSLYRLPPLSGIAGGRGWLAIAGVGLLCGASVLVKYSALPLLLCAAGFVAIRNGGRWNRGNWVKFVAFCGFLLLPGLSLYVLNHTLTGTATTHAKTGLPLFSLGFGQFWNLLGPPLMEVTGWSAILQHGGAGHLWKTEIALTTLLVLLSLIAFSLRRGAESGRRRLVGILGIFTLATFLFLLGLTVRYGHYFDFTSDVRYLYPVVFGWFWFAILHLFESTTPIFVRGAIVATCIFPFLVGAANTLIKPLWQTPPAQLPESRLGAAVGDVAAYRFLHERIAAGLVKPSLIIAQGPVPMVELKVPTVPWFYLMNQKSLRSSQPKVVWVLLPVSEADDLTKRLDPTAKVSDIPVPAGFPWKFLVLEFT